VDPFNLVICPQGLRQRAAATPFERAAANRANDAKLDIRLGGIYALERIARDSETHYEPFYEPVMEVLTAFLREHAPWERAISAQREDSPGEPEQPPTPSMRVDFQAAMTVLGRRDRAHERPDYRLDLRKVDLRRASLSKANFSGDSLSGSNLSGADLQEAVLSGADLPDAMLVSTILVRANFSEADLTGADLTGADLRRADLSRVKAPFECNMASASLHDADLSEAILPHVDLSGEAQLTGANLRGANLYKADLTSANLHSADLSGADLSEAELSKATFSTAILSKASLSKAGLYLADLRGVDLRETLGLSPEQLAEARTDTSTELPEYLFANAGQDSAQPRLPRRPHSGAEHGT
jgi:uncharacterized protein YjbI with pentapeptide repeats